MVILYPVGDRTKQTLIPLIKQHVAPGSTVYSGGWRVYCDLNSIGYKHFTLLHKYSFKKVYINQAMDERDVCHTNKIEGAWKHAKEHFKRMSGTQLTHFEGHLAEVTWRSEVKRRMYDLLRSVYTLQGPPEYHYTTPLFDSWMMESDAATRIAEWKIVPAEWKIVPAEWKIVPAEWKIVPAEWKIVPAEWKIVPAEWKIVPAEWKIVPAEWKIVPAEWKIVPANSNAESEEVSAQSDNEP